MAGRVGREKQLKRRTESSGATAFLRINSYVAVYF